MWSALSLARCWNKANWHRTCYQHASHTIRLPVWPLVLVGSEAGSKEACMMQQMRLQEQFERELCHLIEELTEMALVAEELFGVSARALVARDRVQARKVAEGAGIVPSDSEGGETVQARTLALLHEWSSVTANVR